ncbi:MAG: hypothetical protein IJA56_07215 [Clostridia bacterium]|nr:hypothetical protein [Clostridia bacterium]
MTLKKFKELRTQIFLAMAVCAGIAVFTQSELFMLFVFLLAMGWFVLTALFWRCPHCGTFLGRSTGEYCPHCGKKLEEEGDGQ